MNDAARHDVGEINRRLGRALTAFFIRRVRNLAEAEDLTQEVFVRIVRNLEPDAPVADAYVFRIAANLLRDKARREKVRSQYREARALDDWLGIDPLDPQRVAEGRQDLERVARTIAALPEKTRRIFILYRIEHIDKHAIAESFGLTVRMIEIHIQRALTALSARLEDNP